MIITTWILVFRKDYIWKRARAWKKHGKDQKLDALSILPHMPFPDTLQIYSVFQLEDTVSGTDLWNGRRCSGTLSSARLSSNHSTLFSDAGLWRTMLLIIEFCVVYIHERYKEPEFPHIDTASQEIPHPLVFFLQVVH
jgi:hypothetical protein